MAQCQTHSRRPVICGPKADQGHTAGVQTHPEVTRLQKVLVHIPACGEGYMCGHMNVCVPSGSRLQSTCVRDCGDFTGAWPAARAPTCLLLHQDRRTARRQGDGVTAKAACGPVPAAAPPSPGWWQQWGPGAGEGLPNHPDGVRFLHSPLSQQPGEPLAFNTL